MFEPRTTSRRVGLGAIAIVSVHFALKFMPATGYRESMALAVIAFVSLGGLSSAIQRDIRSGTRSLTQTQEDVLSVALAGLLWLTLVMTARVLFGAPGIGDTAVAPYASSAVAGAGAGAGVRRYHNPRLAESGCVPSPWRVCVIEEWFY